MTNGEVFDAAFAIIDAYAAKNAATKDPRVARVPRLFERTTAARDNARAVLRELVGDRTEPRLRQLLDLDLRSAADIRATVLTERLGSEKYLDGRSRRSKDFEHAVEAEVAKLLDEARAAE